MIRKFLSVERNAALLLLASAVAGFSLANLGASDLIHKIEDLKFGLTLHQWINDVLLGGFFLVIGLELKREFTSGSYKNRWALVTPSLAAILGAVAPAALFIFLIGGDSQLANGWAIPMATDVTFALAVFSAFAYKWQAEASAFLLSFTVLDDIIAVLVIALLIGGEFHPVVFFAFLAILVPQKQTARLEETLHPWVSIVILPLFAFFASAVDLSEGVAFGALTIAILLAPIGKVVGITLGAWLGGIIVGSRVKSTLRVVDFLQLSVLGGIGFTVALLIADLSYVNQPELAAQAKVAVLMTAVLCTIAGVVVLAIKKPVASTDEMLLDESN